MRKKFSRKWFYSIMGACIISVSGIVVPIMVVSNFHKNQIKYNKEYSFSSIEDIKNSFKKANISNEIAQSYINSINNLQTKNSNTDLLSNIIEVQNEISMRRVNNNYSLEELSFDINSVKNVLENDSNSYLHYLEYDQTNYQYLNALYVKNNLSSWFSLNNVVKYDLIFEYTDTVMKSLENFYDLYFLKQLIYKKEVEVREKEIEFNNNQIETIRSEIKIQDELVKEKQSEIDYLRKNYFNSENNFEDIDYSWKKYNDYYISAMTFTTTAAVSLSMTYIPIIGQVAFAIGTAAALTASGLNIGISTWLLELKDQIITSFDRSLSELGIAASEAYLDWKIYNTMVKYMVPFKELKNKIILETSKVLQKVLIALTIITSIFSMVTMPIEHNKIQDSKNEYKNTAKNEYNKVIDGSIGQLKSDISSIASDIARKNDKISELNFRNNDLSNEISSIHSNSEFLETNHVILPNTFNEIPMFNKKKIEAIRINSNNKINSMTNYDLKKIYEVYDGYMSQWIVNKNIRNNTINNFILNYNYDDKIYWSEIMNNIIEVKFSEAINLFIIE